MQVFNRVLRLAALCSVQMCTVALAQTPAPHAVMAWSEATLEEVRRSRMGPPVVARALAISHTCMYDAWVPYHPHAAAAVLNQPRRPASEHTDQHKALAVSQAAHRCLVNLFPAGSARLGAVLQGLGHARTGTPAAGSPEAIGLAAADAVIASRRHDGANQYGDLAPGAYADWTGYAPANAPMPFCLPTTAGPCALNVSDPYRWQPLINDRGAVQTAIAPHWGRVRPFALSAGSQFDTLPTVADGPNYLSSPAAYAADIDSMLSFSRNLTAQQKLIVEYWADGPESELPPGHWMLFAQHVSRRDSNTLDEDVRMMFALANATLDAGIVGWHQKRKWDGVRPITGIRYFRQGQTVLAWGGPGRPVEPIDAGKWSPYNPGSNLSPSFQGYVSGHSTFSAAGAVALRQFTGSDRMAYSTVVPPGFGRVEPGVPAVPTELRYASFSDAVRDAGLSRLYAGIHFADDNTDGQLLGHLAGAAAWDKSQRLFAGQLPDLTVPAGTDVQCFNRTLVAQTVGNVTVPSGARCLLIGTRLKGNLQLGANAAVQASQAVISGNVQGSSRAALRLAGGSVAGSVQVYNHVGVALTGVRIDGSVQIKDGYALLRIQDLQVAGSVQLQSQFAPSVVTANKIQGELSCDGFMQKPAGGGNVAASRRGACAGL